MREPCARSARNGEKESLAQEAQGTGLSGDDFIHWDVVLLAGDGIEKLEGEAESDFRTMKQRKQTVVVAFATP